VLKAYVMASPSVAYLVDAMVGKLVVSRVVAMVAMKAHSLDDATVGESVVMREMY
jgi:hypothetical protein